MDWYGKLEDIQDKAAFNNFLDSMGYSIEAGIFHESIRCARKKEQMDGP